MISKLITLTQDKREELIERYSQQIETFKYHLSQIGTDHSDGEAYSELLLKTEIALASLTVEFKTVRLFGNYGEGERCWVECDPLEEGAQKIYSARQCRRLIYLMTTKGLNIPITILTT